MALKKSLVSQFGTTQPNAYSKVTRVDVNCYDNTMDITINTWADEAARVSGSSPMKHKHYESVPCVPASGSNIVEQAYAYAKQGSEWSGSIDV